eukprot:TRINITY_DN3588_c0_g1_i5.p1 TRINITY_DN3588_c0_g1~~TRINITY_DN3588_c0_g1_i5.p1  ORF type:complete len:315 (+),score=41.17 TRINITY_DN3588_c0_g1_i5:108-1052(+)
MEETERTRVVRSTYTRDSAERHKERALLGRSANSKREKKREIDFEDRRSWRNAVGLAYSETPLKSHDRAVLSEQEWKMQNSLSGSSYSYSTRREREPRTATFYASRERRLGSSPSISSPVPVSRRRYDTEPMRSLSNDKVLKDLGRLSQLYNSVRKSASRSRSPPDCVKESPAPVPSDPPVPIPQLLLRYCKSQGVESPSSTLGLPERFRPIPSANLEDEPDMGGERGIEPEDSPPAIQVPVPQSSSPDVSPSPLPPPILSEDRREKPRSSAPCIYYTKGSCVMGENCRFVHSTSSNPPEPLDYDQDTSVSTVD